MLLEAPGAIILYTLSESLICFWLGTDPSIFGCVEHLLVVANKPIWKSAVVQLARRLQEIGTFYKFVGGVAMALHGVPIYVKDLDIEMSQSDAYRF